MAFSDLFGSLNFGGGGGMMNLLTIVGIAFGSLVLVGGIIFYFYNLSRWNIKKVYFRIPRDVKYLEKGEELDINSIRCSVTTEIGKGMYDAKRGVVWLKRKRKRKIFMKPFNIAEFLQSNTELEVIQVSADKYLPVMPQSYVLYEDDATKQQAVLINMKSDVSKDKSWKENFERSSKAAFSIMNLLREYQTPIMIGLVIILWGIQLLILYNRLKG